MRLTQLTTGAAATKFAYDGLAMIAEYDAANVLQRRFVHGPGSDEPLVHYVGAGLTNRRWLHADERGSIVGMSDSAGTVIAKNSYDEYGIPGAANIGRFQYTGQAWLAEIGLQYSKNRIYSPWMGRFLQTDPIGIEGGINLYAYVENDPVNMVDPSGLQACGFTNSFEYYDQNNDGKWNRGEKRLPGSEKSEPNVCSGLQLSFANVGVGLFVGGGKITPPQKPQCPRDANPSRNFMHKSTSAALRSVPGGGRSGPLSTEFARVTHLPNFRSGGWSSVGSSHARQAFEHSLPGSDRVVKVYIGDSNFNGANTVTITSPTGTFEHYAEFPPYALGYPVNTGNANDYWRDRLGCQ